VIYAKYLWAGFRRIWRHADRTAADRFAIAAMIFMYPLALAVFVCMPSWREQARQGHAPWI
jgi:hypothetical protein